MATKTKKVMPKVEAEAPEAEGPVAKDARVVIASISMDPVVQEQLLTLAKGVLLTSANAGLVHLGDNISNVDFGRFKGTIVTIVGVAVRELRNLLNGGMVIDGNFPVEDEKEDEVEEKPG